MADVLSLLENDHRVVENLLDELAKSDPGPEREQMVQQLVSSLELHMTFEEREIYPMLRAIDAETEQEAENEHALTRDGLAKLQELVAEPGFAAVVDMLVGGISHHVEDEEGEAWPMLREQGDRARLEQLSAQLIAAKRAANVLEAELAQLTKEQLLDAARLADVDGRSSMTTEELRQALVVGS